MPKKLFLIDGIGALISTFMLGFVLVKFQYLVGLPKNSLYVLSIIPCAFVIYSFSCFFILPENWKLYLKIIAFLNFLYCLFTASLIILYFKKITFLGLLYFVLEFIIIITLIFFELKTAHVFTRKNN